MWVLYSAFQSKLHYQVSKLRLLLGYSVNRIYLLKDKTCPQMSCLVHNYCSTSTHLLHFHWNPYKNERRKADDVRGILLPLMSIPYNFLFSNKANTTMYEWATAAGSLYVTILRLRVTECHEAAAIMNCPINSSSHGINMTTKTFTSLSSQCSLWFQLSCKRKLFHALLFSSFSVQPFFIHCHF